MVSLYLFIVAIIVQCLYALLLFMRIFRLPKAAELPAGERQAVSVIICAKNEAENLKKNLAAVLSQKYPDDKGKAMYEVIVVNDASTDDTTAVLRDLEQRYDNLWDVIVTPDETRTLKGKKHALSKGILHAKHDWLLLTDADCYPWSEEWLTQMVAPLAQGKEIVAGYGGFYERTGLLNAFIRWETVHTFLQYSTYALAGIPYMAVGRNMACTKATLDKAQTHPAWNKLPSGDDDMLISICGNASNVAIVSKDAAFTRSEAETNWRDWAKQKQRHLSTGKYYKWHIKLLLGVYGVSHAITWLVFLALLFTEYRETALLVMGLRCLLYWIIWTASARKLLENKLVYFFPLFDFGWLVYNFVFFPYIAWKNKTNWK